jgi:hypothetical protein
LSIDPTTGTLSGTPTIANVGMVTVKVHVEEITLPSNFADQIFTFNVLDIGTSYYGTNFEGACPNGWTLSGDWQCGAPTLTPLGGGPATAFSGAQVIATVLTDDYSSSDAYATNTATSPTVNLTGATSAKLRFRVWLDTEGSSFDGFNLKVSSDGGPFNLINTVTPTYPLTVGGESAWGGHDGALGYRLYQADLSQFVNHQIQLRFAFRSDSSGEYPGVYIDDVVVSSN